MRRNFRRRGAGLVEAAVSIAVFSGLVLAVVMVLRATTRLSGQSRAKHQAGTENRASLQAVANALRGAAASTLTGFDASNVSAAPRYQTVTGWVLGARTFSAATQIEWRATPAVPGVANPGEVVLVQSGVTSRLAKCVPSGGFTVTRRGDSLHIHINSFSGTSTREISHASGDAIVRLRN
jgi:hypothetical protein